MRRICTIVAFAVLLATPGMANLLTNGSFENGIFTPSPIPTYNGGDPLFVGSTAMTGWTVVDNNGLTSNTNQSIAWLPTGSYGLFAQNGGDFLDLTGYFEAAQNGVTLTGPWAGVQQTVNLLAGNYALTFWLGDDEVNPLYQGTVSVLVSGNNLDPVFSNTAEGGNWQLEDYNFTVPFGGPTAITILGNFTSGGYYIGLDNVDLEATPEPGTALLAFPAVAGLLWYGRRKNLLRFKTR
jgi:hypothetical protein